MERKIDEWSKSQNVSLEQTEMTDPPPPQAHTEHVNAIFTGSGKYESRKNTEDYIKNLKLIEKEINSKFNDLPSRHQDQQVVSKLVEETLNKKNTISAQDLIIKEKMESQSETTQTVSALKLPILKTGDYDLWSMRMEQYLTHIDYALWEVIVNGDAPVVVSASAEGPIPPKTAEQKLARKNELKAKSTLLLAIPDEHLLKFHGIKHAKTLWVAIKARFGGVRYE
ncbi:hypothetical protein Tco_1215377 [Tanacetum coccineum]